MAEDSLVNTDLQPDSVDEEELATDTWRAPPLSETQSESSSGSDNEAINHGKTETPKKGSKGSKKEKEELTLKLKNLYNKEDSKNSKPKKEEKERGEKKYVLKPKTSAVRTAILPNPGYKQYIKQGKHPTALLPGFEVQLRSVCAVIAYHSTTETQPLYI